MRKKGYIAISFILTIVMLTLMVPVASVSADSVQKEFFVATDGSDDNQGTIDAPFATLQKARNTIRDIKDASGLPIGGIRVYVRGGTYNLNSSFTLTKDDSGTAESPISYRAYNNEKVVITGGYDLDVSQFTKVKDKAVLDLLPKNAQKNIYQFDLKAIGVKSFPPVQPFGWGYPGVSPDMQVYYNSNLLQIARYPNEGFLKTGVVADKGKMTGEVNGDFKTGGAKFYYDDSELDRLSGYEKGILMFGYWRFGWATNDLAVTEINSKDKYVQLEGPTGYGVESDKEYYVYNSIRLLDAPGEYFIDRDNGILYLYPQGDMANSSVQLSKVNFDLISMTDTSYVTLANLDLTLTLGNGVVIRNGNDNLIRNCNIYRIAGNGVNITCADSKTDNRNGIINSEVYNIGNTAVNISAGNRKALKAGNCFAYNNKIHDFGQVTKVYERAINLSGCGNMAKYNETYNGPHQALALDGNDQVMEYNNVYAVSKTSNDTGAIYSYGQNSYLGFQINNNYFHDISSELELGAGVMAIYMDDFIGGCTIDNNIINNVNNTGIFVKGKNITIKHNIIKDTSRGLYLSDFDVGRTDVVQTLFDSNTKNGFLSDTWFAKYPFWKDSSKVEGGDLPTNNVITDNILIGANESVETNFAAGAEIKNVKMDASDAGFVDAANGNYELKDDSPIYTKITDFPKSQFSKIGLYTNRFNAINQNQVSLFINSPIAFAKGVETKVDPTNPDVMPVILNDRTLVPVRFISESFGAQVGWDGDTRTVSVSLGDQNIKLVLDSAQMDVNGTAQTLEVPAQVISDRTMIPLRALVESLGKKVFWDPRGLISIGDSDTPFGEDSYLVDALIYNFR